MSNIGQIHKTEYELTSGRSKTVVKAEAPGRIHFLGGQGDPAYGFFLSAAIDRYIKLAVDPRKDNNFRFFAADFKERKRGTLANLKFKREDKWANYIKTAIFVFLDLGCPIKGLNFSVCGDIPQQAGLAASTAIEVSAAIALKNLYKVKISDKELIKKLYYTHERLFNSSSSLADYQICFSARKDQFLVTAVSEKKIEKIKSPFSKYSILLVDSRVPRLSVESELALRKEDTLKGLEYLSGTHEGNAFKDFGSQDLLDALGDFPEQIRRRTTHIVEEIHRVADAAAALQKSDLAALSKIIYHSHESLRDYYEISCPEIDWLVKRAQELEGVAGSRMIGDGFGGCTYAFVRRDLADEYIKRLEEYERIFGFKPIVHEIKIATGARLYANTADKR